MKIDPTPTLQYTDSPRSDTAPPFETDPRLDPLCMESDTDYHRFVETVAVRWSVKCLPKPSRVPPPIWSEGKRPSAPSGTGPLSAEESLRHDDARWAMEAPEVLARYVGEFVVPHRREVVAHGTDAAAVLVEAARITGAAPKSCPGRRY